MVGGRAVVTAAKVAGIQVAKGGFLGGFGFPAPATEQLKNAAASVANPSVEDEAMIMRPVWDDWEFAGIEDDEPIPRVVFNKPPTLQEAKEATEDLKEAIDLVYKSSAKPSSVSEGLKGLTGFQSTDNRVVESAVPQVALQAFSFLSENTATQSLVASIASDPKVWDAVMENKVLMKFLNARVVESDDDESNESGDLDLSEEKTKEFLEILQDMRLKVIKLMENVSSNFGGLFGGLGSDTDIEDGEDKNQTFLNDPRTLFGLAVVVIFLVALKRAEVADIAKP